MSVLLYGTLLAYIIFYVVNNYISLSKVDVIFSFLKLILLSAISVSCVLYMCFIYYYYVYYMYNNNYVLFSEYSVLPKIQQKTLFFFEFSVDLFGIAILFLAFFVGILSLLALDSRIFWKNIRYLFFLNYFIILVFFFVFSTNLLLFFLFYELLLIPSFLVVYFISPSRRSIQASLYFLIWTQIGSFLVLLAVILIISRVGSSEYANIINYPFSGADCITLYLLIFLGFGFKVPIWPFHFWLTKTHVEAPAGFSMFLSGFLVKTALYGFYKTTMLLSCDFNTTVFTALCIMGVFDASFKMWGQTDLKKLVAYGTIQEMNLIYLTLCCGDNNLVIGGILFSITHGALSTLMFYIVDCIQRRYNSRSIVEISGILQLTPMLGISAIIMCVIYSGIPGTLKFTSEFFIFCSLFGITPTITVLLFFVANVLGVIGFSKCWFNAIFGMSLKNYKSAPYDLTVKETYVIYINIAFLIAITFFCNLFF